MAWSGGLFEFQVQNTRTKIWFGDNCRNEHPQGQGFGNRAFQAAQPSRLFSIESISNDLSPQIDRPGWLLSSYGPKHQPTLIGVADVSPEEMRVKAFEAVKSGNIQQYVAYETSQFTAAEQKLSDAKANLQAVFSHARKNEENPASATPFVTTTPVFASASSVFGTPTNASAFGKPSGFGAFAGSSPSAFGSSASNPSGSAFGQSAFSQPRTTPSVFGSSSQSNTAFGQSSQPASAFGPSSQPVSAFGQPSQNQGLSAFSNPSQNTPAFGQSSQPVSAFGQAQSTSAFGKPSQPSPAFGQSSQPTGAFGSTQTSSSAFGQTSQPASAFGQSAFGQTQPQSSLLKPATGAFGSAGGGAFSGNTPNPGGFSAFAGRPSAFGLGNSNSPPVASAFGQSSFGNTPTAPASQSAFGAPSAFGSPIAPANTGSTFGANPPGSAFASGTGFGSSASTSQSAFGTSAPIQPQSAFASNSSITSPFSATEQPPPSQPKPKSTKPDFANFQARYQPGINKYDDLLPPNYMDLLPKAAREAFESPVFEWGNIPEWVPPKELR